MDQPELSPRIQSLVNSAIEVTGYGRASATLQRRIAAVLNTLADQSNNVTAKELYTMASALRSHAEPTITSFEEKKHPRKFVSITRTIDPSQNCAHILDAIDEDGVAWFRCLSDNEFDFDSWTRLTPLPEKN